MEVELGWWYYCLKIHHDDIQWPPCTHVYKTCHLSQCMGHLWMVVIIPPQNATKRPPMTWLWSSSPCCIVQVPWSPDNTMLKNFQIHAKIVIAQSVVEQEWVVGVIAIPSFHLTLSSSESHMKYAGAPRHMPMRCKKWLVQCHSKVDNTGTFVLQRISTMTFIEWWCCKQTDANQLSSMCSARWHSINQSGLKAKAIRNVDHDYQTALVQEYHECH